MPGNKFSCPPVCSPDTLRTRLERLLCERELRRINKIFSSSDELSKNTVEGELFTNGSVSAEDEHSGTIKDEALLEVVDGSEFPDSWPSKQRLLVVANRLPVSPVRQSENSWKLEISVGG